MVIVRSPRSRFPVGAAVSPGHPSARDNNRSVKQLQAVGRAVNGPHRLTMSGPVGILAPPLAKPDSQPPALPGDPADSEPARGDIVADDLAGGRHGGDPAP